MRRTKNRTIALCIALIILSLIGAILSMQVSGETSNDKGAEYEQREADD
jgi:hypothetical protein